MKKLIILAALCCAAVAAQAASVRWMTSGVKDSDGTASYSGSATLYVVSGSSEKAVGTANMNNGSINTTISFTGYTGSVELYYTMTDTSDNTFMSGTKTVILGTSTSMVNFGANGTWTVVPEPTSGLLMLVGLAGLALKRKRA